MNIAGIDRVSSRSDHFQLIGADKNESFKKRKIHRAKFGCKRVIGILYLQLFTTILQLLKKQFFNEVQMKSSC